MTSLGLLSEKDPSGCSAECQLEGEEMELKATLGIWTFSHVRYKEQKTVPPLSNKVLGQEEAFKYIGELMIEIK